MGWSAQTGSFPAARRRKRGRAGRFPGQHTRPATCRMPLDKSTQPGGHFRRKNRHDRCPGGEENRALKARRRLEKWVRRSLNGGKRSYHLLGCREPIRTFAGKRFQLGVE